MGGKRKEPVTRVCTVCGKEFESWSCKIPLYCPPCLQERRDAAKKRHDQKRRADPEFRAKKNAKKREARRNDPDRSQKDREAYLRRKRDPGFMEEGRARAKKYYQEHKEELRAKARARHIEHREEKLPKMREYSRLSRKAKTDSGAAIRLLEWRGQLKECVRLKFRAMNLPCGKRQECFGNPRCPNCPEGATPPNAEFVVWNHYLG